jgi:hypothetical protein
MRCAGEGGVAGAALPELRVASPWPLTGFLVRACTPDGGHPNLSFKRRFPRTPAVRRGVNDRGLAGVAIPLAAPARGDIAALRSACCCSIFSASSVLDSVEKALEMRCEAPARWRPRAALVFCDAVRRQRRASRSTARSASAAPHRPAAGAGPRRARGGSQRADARSRSCAGSEPTIASPSTSGR